MNPIGGRDCYLGSGYQFRPRGDEFTRWRDQLNCIENTQKGMLYVFKFGWQWKGRNEFITCNSKGEEDILEVLPLGVWTVSLAYLRRSTIVRIDSTHSSIYVLSSYYDYHYHYHSYYYYYYQNIWEVVAYILDIRCPHEKLFPTLQF